VARLGDKKQKGPLETGQRYSTIHLCDYPQQEYESLLLGPIVDRRPHSEPPADHKGVALVLIGPKGIGKTFFAEIICALTGDKYGFITANKNDIFGDFNGHLYLMFVAFEEAVWANNHQIESILKVFISGKRRPSTKKHHDTQMINNYVRSLILANPGWVVPVSLDERRYMILNPSEARMKDLKYFGALKDGSDSGGLAALMYFFQHYRIGRGKTDIRSAPRTEGFFDQQEESLQLFESWLLEEFLFTGVVRCCGLDNIKDVNIGMQINRSDMYEQYLEWSKKAEVRGNKLNSRKFGIKFGSYFPLFDANGKVQKNAKGRIISIFTYADTTNAKGHIYDFPVGADQKDRANEDWAYSG
jgi:hypothetical protein